MQSGQPIDLVTLVAMLLAGISSAHAAGHAAPYVLTFVLALVAASAAAADSEEQQQAPRPRWATVRMILTRATLTTSVAVGVSVWLESVTGLRWSWSLAVVAIVLSYVGVKEATLAVWGEVKRRLGGGAGGAPR